MKLNICLTVTAFILATTVSINAQTEKTVVSPPNPATVKAPMSGKTVAPAFNLTSLEGKKLELAALRGKVVVLNFWFTGCEPCVAEMPKLNELVEKFKNEDVVFIAPTWDTESVSQDFLKKTTFKYNVVANASSLIVRTYRDGTGNVTMPTQIIIDKEGNIEIRITGGLLKTNGDTKQFEEFSDIITRLLKQPYVKETEKPSTP